jgi:signal transduction histidine kinase
MQRKTDQLSHEMQTPIQDVLAKTDNVLTLWPALAMDDAQLQKAGLPHTTLDDLHRRVRQAWYASRRLRTVAQTLTLGSYMADYRFAECSLLPLLYDAKANYMAEAQSRHIDIEIRMRQDVGEPPIIECSPEHLQLVLNNLMHNAVKYSYKGGEWRRRYVRVSGQFAGDRFELVFANYGIGILPDEIQSGKIFEDGYQGALRQGEFRTGSGKGLFFVKSVIERHHGEIEITSDPRSDDESGSDDKLPYLTRVTLFLPRRQPSS